MSEPEAPESAMATGTDGGTPGVHPNAEESAVAAPEDVVHAVADDVPLPSDTGTQAVEPDPDTPVFLEP